MGAARPDVLSILLDHFMLDAPLFQQGTAAGIEIAPETAMLRGRSADADIIDQIKELLDTRVRPAVAQDGGDIVYRGYKDGSFTLACRAPARLPVVDGHAETRGRSLIKYYVPEVETIEAV